VKETAFESLPLQLVIVPIPIAPDREVVLFSGGLNTNTSTIPGCAISAAVMAASSWWLLTNVVMRKEPFQLTDESWRKSLPLTVNTNWLPPAVVLLGEMELMKGRGGQTPQDEQTRANDMISRQRQDDRTREGKVARGVGRIFASTLGWKAAAANKTDMAGWRYMKHLWLAARASGGVARRGDLQWCYRLLFCGVSRKCKT
jgi:hypothetical protein